MAVTATTVAAATTMLAAVAAVFLTLVLCFYIFLCAKRYRGGAPPPPPHAGAGGVRAWLRVVFGGSDGGAGAHGGGATEWCYDGGLDDKSMAKLPRREVAKGEALDDCAVCITELAPGDTARVLPRCGHAFHVDCVDMWLRSHSTCPLCRCPAVDDPPVPPAVPTPEADAESPNFPTNVLFFGSQDEVSTGRSQTQHHPAPAPPPLPAPLQEHPAVAEAARACAGLRRLIGCGGATPPTQPPHRCDRQQHHRQEEEEDAGGDIEMGLAAAGGESSASRPVKPPQPGS